MQDHCFDLALPRHVALFTCSRQTTSQADGNNVLLNAWEVPDAVVMGPCPLSALSPMQCHVHLWCSKLPLPKELLPSGMCQLQTVMVPWAVLVPSWVGLDTRVPL